MRNKKSSHHTFGPAENIGPRKRPFAFEAEMLSKEQNLTGDKSPSAICSGKTTETSYGSNSFAVAPAVRQTAKRFVDVRINRVAVYLDGILPFGKNLVTRGGAAR